MPWQRYLLDMLADPTVDWVVVLKAAQMGVSELIRCAIGRWSVLDPGDVLWVMADEKSANKAMTKLQTMFRNTPSIRHLLPQQGQNVRGRRRKVSLKELVLTNGMRVVIGWAGSASSLASDPFRYVILDETGLYPPKIGREGSPVGLAEERTKTFGRRRKIVLLSKPAHPDDVICTAHAECLDQRERHVPCPECGELQPLEWGRVRWEGPEGGDYDPSVAPNEPAARLQLAAHVEATQAAWIQCRACKARISDTHGADADPRAAWLEVGSLPGQATRRRAVHISELYHWSRTVADLVARFLRAIKAGDRQNFHTGSLGLPYEQERGDIRPEMFAAKAIHPPGVVPEWASTVLATADTQKDHFWYVVRAWGGGDRSRLLTWGRANSFDELHAKAFQSWPVQGQPKRVRAELLMIDAGGGGVGVALDGSRTHEVYRFAADTPRVIAIRGSGEKHGAHQGHPITWTQVTFGNEKRKLRVCQPHANYWKDELSTLVRSDRWEESTAAADPEYGRHMAGQRQVWEESASGDGRWVWRKRSGRPDHIWDCSYYQVVAAEVVGAATRQTVRERQSDDEPTGRRYKRRERQRWRIGGVRA